MASEVFARFGGTVDERPRRSTFGVSSLGASGIIGHHREVRWVCARSESGFMHFLCVVDSGARGKLASWRSRQPI